MSTIRIRVINFCTAAAFAVALCGAWLGAAVAADEPPAQRPANGDSRAAIKQQYLQRVQAHLDQLAARLEIKASQEPAWQAFCASIRDLMAPLHEGGWMDARTARSAEPDAAALAREHADRVAERAQKLVRLADATAKLQQVLGGDQRLVLNEAARHFAQEHFGHRWVAQGNFHGRQGPHCEAGRESGHERGHADGPHGRWENGESGGATRGDGDNRDGMPH